MKIRQMKVAGGFYPSWENECKSMLETFYNQVETFYVDETIKAWVVPHAWWIYSWIVAMYTYKAIEQQADKLPSTILLCWPDHYIWMNKVLVGNYDFLETPFWQLQTDKEIINYLLKFSDYFTDAYLDYDQEHSIEVQLPFIKFLFWDKFKVVPLIFWWVNIVDIAQILDTLKEKVLFLVSSDLSHYLPYDEATKKDSITLDIFINKKLEKLHLVDACWIYPWGMVSILAKKYNWEAKLLKYLNSWDTAWDKSAVVGYSSVIYY